jgi:chromosomal replication initiator protein
MDNSTPLVPSQDTFSSESSGSNEGSATDAAADAATGQKPKSDTGQAEPGSVMQAAWGEVMDVLQAELSGPTFNNYLRHIRPLSLRQDTLTLSVPSDFVKDWLVRRFARRIEETLEQFLGRPIILTFQTASSVESYDPETAPLLDTISEPERTAAAIQEQEDRDTRDALPINAPFARGSSTQLESQSRQASNAASSKAARDLAGLEDFSSSPLNKKYTFENFIVGRSNYVSHAASWAVANAPAKGQYNPLFIYGGVGLGKTHLMQAIGHFINTKRSSPAEIVYVSGENFLYQVVRCIREDRMTAFRRMYRNVDIWLVDDIQYICNAERTEVEFFHIFNTLYDQGKQIVICSDKPPKDLELTEGRLISRFEWGLITYIEPPDLEHRIAILQKRAQAEGVNVDPAVLQYLAEKIRSNIRSLEGSLTRLLAMASLDGRRINIELAAETVRHYSTVESEPVKVDVETIIQVVAEHFKMKEADILGKKRNKEIVAPRQIAMFLAREMGSMSYPDIGRAFGRDYTTVIHSYEKVKAEIKKDSSLKNTVAEIRSKAHARG